MKTLDEFKNIHKGKDIYVIASGYSAEFLDPGFFEDKICVGINQAYKKFPCAYLVRKEHAHCDVVLKEAPNSIVFVTKHNCGLYRWKTMDKVIADKNLNTENLVIYDHNDNNEKMVDKLPENGLVATLSTITSGIHLAAHMGAKTIILVGHDCGTLDNKCNFTGYHSKETLAVVWPKGEEQYRAWLQKIEGQTITLKKLIFDVYGCHMYSLNPFINFGLEGHVFKRS